MAPRGKSDTIRPSGSEARGMLEIPRPWRFAAIGFTWALCAPALPAAQNVPTQGSFLVANRDLGDPNFSRTVVLLIECDEEGALGLVINRATEVELSRAMPDLEGPGIRGQFVFLGGPVERTGMRALVRSTEELEDSFPVFGDVRFSNSKTLLERLARQSGGKIPFRVYAGYSGWGPGQLENEIARGDWLVRPGDADYVFFEG